MVVSAETRIALVGARAMSSREDEALGVRESGDTAVVMETIGAARRVRACSRSA